MRHMVLPINSLAPQAHSLRATVKVVTWSGARLGVHDSIVSLSSAESWRMELIRCDLIALVTCSLAE